MLAAGRDAQGAWATVRCDHGGCAHHVALRPADPDDRHLYDLVCAAFDLAADDGWRFAGLAWCPEHVPDDVERLETVGERYDWVNIGRSH